MLLSETNAANTIVIYRLAGGRKDARAILLAPNELAGFDALEVAKSRNHFPGY